MMCSKHAYLILAHEYSEVFYTLLKLLDDERNDIFIHIDKKNQCRRPLKYTNDLINANVYWFSKIKVKWGTDSIVKAQIYLLNKATSSGKYLYYHLLSGADLPLKTQDEIYNFFKDNDGKEFIHLGTEQYQKDIESRYKIYHFFEGKIGRKRESKFWLQLETYSRAIQRRLHVDRTRHLKEFSFYGGAQWFSITDSFARYAIASYKKKKHLFMFTQCPDELIMQTLLMNSKYKNSMFIKGFTNDYHASVRDIDWGKGNPYVWRSCDKDELLNSNNLFARKFDSRVDKEIVNILYEYLHKGSN